MALNTRIYPRHQIRIPLRFRSEASFRDAWTADISRGGVFVETSEAGGKLKAGQTVTVELTLPGKAGTVELSGRIVHVRSEPPPGIGLEFGPLLPKSRKTLDAYVDRLGLETPKVR